MNTINLNTVALGMLAEALAAPNRIVRSNDAIIHEIKPGVKYSRGKYTLSLPRRSTSITAAEIDVYSQAFCVLIGETGREDTMERGWYITRLTWAVEVVAPPVVEREPNQPTLVDLPVSEEAFSYE